MKKKIFIITGEASGDKLAADIVPYFSKSKYNILAVGSEKLKKKKIKLLTILVVETNQTTIVGMQHMLDVIVLH